MNHPTVAVVVVAGSKASLDEFREKFGKGIVDADETVLIVNPSYRFGSLAQIGNWAKTSLKSDVVCMIHADVSLGEGYLRRLAARAYETKGVTGLVGLTWGGRFLWAGERKIDWMPKDRQQTWLDGGTYPVSTLDPCCVTFRRDSGLFFDQERFDKAHLFVEDLCTEAQKFGLPVEVVDGAAGHIGGGVRDPEENKRWIEEYNLYARRFADKWTGRFYRVQLLYPRYECDPKSSLTNLP